MTPQEIKKISKKLSLLLRHHRLEIIQTHFIL